jgi:hypothetical protein
VAPLPSASTVPEPTLPLLHPKVQMKIDLLALETKKGTFALFVLIIAMLNVTLLWIESWENKKQFPPGLRAIIQEAAKLAIDTRTFSSDSIVPHLTNLLPYNAYTMKVGYYCCIVSRFP